MAGAAHEGVLVIDKPAGPTSHDVVARVRRILGTRRVGHTGTLDPAATGVLVVAVGRATRLVEVLQAGVKTYAARVTLGVETDSQDTTGVVVARTSAARLTEAAVCEALMAFQGPIMQVPPMVSAIKVGGERLHAKARRGETVERAARAVTITDLVLEDFTPGEEASVSFLVTCSTGTYVRTIAHDLGRTLGVGGSLAHLRRLANGSFTLDDAVTLDALEAHVAAGTLGSVMLTPLDALARIVPVIDVDAEVARRLVHGSGARIARAELPTPGSREGGAATTVALRHDGRLVALHDVALDDVAGDATDATTGGPDADAGSVATRARLVWAGPEDLG